MRSETLGFLAAALGSSVLSGLAVITATVLLVDTLGDRASPESMSPRLYLVFGGTLAGILTAALVAWHRLGPIASDYRRGGLAIVTGFATVLLMLVCIPIDQMLGRSGLIALWAVSLLAAVLLGRRAKRLGARA